ncbi:RDD family protein [Neobacillus sp. NPDC093182]|uniref:RDD family protein n=1 Tax=Neobacillus sp. NPDC093182 TaxID=3364297 RepID=UPI003809FABB
MSSDNTTTKRIIAFVIDYFLITLLTLLGILLFLHYAGDDEYRVTKQIGNFINTIVFTLPLFKDSFIKRSIGKRIFGLKIYNSNGMELHYWQILLRNITLIISIIELVVFLSRSDKKRLGDLIAKTYVGPK